MAIDIARSTARLAAFRLVEAVQVRDDVSDALTAARDRATAQGWPEVTRILLYAEVVQASLRSDPAEPEWIDRLREAAEQAGDRAMLSVALASRADHRSASSDTARPDQVDDDLSRATALAGLSTDAAMERATAYIACAVAYSMRDLWELEEELYAAVTPVLADCELPSLRAAVLVNRAEASLRLLCGLREVDDAAGLLERRIVAQEAVDAAVHGDLPGAWSVEVNVYAHLLSALVEGRTVEPSEVLDQQVGDLVGLGQVAATGLLRLADALCAAHDADWPAAGLLAERAIESLPDPFASSARALALRLAAQAEAAHGGVGAEHALRYADYNAHRHWQSRMQMVGAARASTHTEHLRIERDIHARHALVDELTGLSNRRGYNRHLERLQRRRIQQPLAVLLVDIDDFKAVNDTYGHGTGDEVLVRVARALSAGTRPTDMVARLGGDEFVTLLDEFDAAAACARATELLTSLAAEAWDELAPGLTIAVSIGVAVCTSCEEPPEAFAQLVERADAALYAAKALGGASIEVAAAR
jgi:diguanylate cyclase (GGDEF)-like protein